MLTCIVEKNNLLFHEPGRHKVWKELISVPLENVLSGSFEAAEIPAPIRKKKQLSLLIVPDYWIGTSFYNLQSIKKHIVDVFISRKLLSEFPAIPEIRNFFTCSSFQNELGENSIHTSFLQEPAAFALFDRLTKIGLPPFRITSSALLWEQKLGNAIPDFAADGSALLYFNEDGCCQYFFDQGRFLFSRFTAFPEQKAGGGHDYDEIIYEVTQSMHMYAQKTKSDISTFYLASSGEEKTLATDVLSEHLESDVVNICEDPSLSTSFNDLPSLSNTETTLSFIKRGKIVNIAGLSHRIRQRELEWRPTQKAGIFIGLVLVLVLGMELLQLRQIEAVARSSLPGTGEKTLEQRNEDLLKFKSAVDFVIDQKNRPDPVSLTKRISTSIPKNAWLRELKINIEEPVTVVIKSTFDAKDTDELHVNLVQFLEKLHDSVPGSGDVTLNDLKIARPEIDGSTTSQKSVARGYDIEMEFGIK